MKLTICGSMQFHREMTRIKRDLTALGHTAYTPSELDNLERNESYMESDEDRVNAKIEYDFIREHFRKIELADGILVLNFEKKGIPGYVGGNTFLEMGYAFGLGKKIFLLHPVPQMDYTTEMLAMQPVVISNNLTQIPQ